MKLKRYLQFIRESLKEDIESRKKWELDEDQIREYLIEMSDAEYLIVVNFGFAKESNLPNGNYYYTEDIESGDSIRPAYWIEISKSRHVSGDDVTDSLIFAYSMIEYEGECDVELRDKGGVLDLDSILIKSGFFTDVDPDDEYSGLELEGNLILFAKQKNTIEITQKDLEQYYGWNVSVKKEDKLWAEMDLEDLADFILSSRSEYKDCLVKGQEYMWDYYDISNYYPDIMNLFKYDLDKENEVLVVKSLIKEVGGLGNVINHIGDECDDDVYESVKDMSEDELINYLLKERYYTTIKQLVSNSEMFMEVKDIVANWEMSAHCDDNYNSIVSNFDSIVSDELGQYEKVEKEVLKKYTINGQQKEYKTYITFYQFPYSNDWISDIDSEYLFNSDLDELFRDWLREQNIDRNLNPRIHDWGSVDRAEMNKEIKSYLKRYLQI